MQTCNIMGVNIAVTDMEKTLRLVEDNCEAWRGKYICVANVHTTVTAHDDPTYLRVQNGAVMALPDGGPLSRYSRKKGFADAARVTGPDLMRELLKESGTKHYRHYFYGSTQETLDILREKITEKYPYEAGNIRRAPAWMQRCNLEWLYRLMQDPKRLFKRYFVTNTKFLWWSWRH